MQNKLISPTANVSSLSKIGEGTIIDSFVIIDDYAQIGEECKIHQFVHIDQDVIIEDRVKIQNHVFVPHGVTLCKGVFVGPSVVFTNDKHPRSITPDGRLKTNKDWTMSPTVVNEGASLGAGSVIVCGVTIGKWAMIGAGSVVCHDVPDYALVVGSPARIIGYVDESGHRKSE